MTSHLYRCLYKQGQLGGTVTDTLSTAVSGSLCCFIIIRYITEHLDPINYLLNFGIIALHELRPKVIIRFTLKNIRNNLKQSWTQLLEGETLEDLFDGVYGAVEIHKIDVW